jgi:hypothetical protein
MNSGAPLTLPWTAELKIRLKSINLTDTGAECEYTLPFSNNRVILRPFQIENDFHTRMKVPKQEIIAQGKYECGPAAIAMVTGHSLFHVKRLAGKAGWRNDSSGINWEASKHAYQSLGFSSIYVHRTRIFGFNDEFPPAVLTVPSLNYKGRWHAVAWVNGEILDPNMNYPGRKTYGPEWNPFTIGASGAEILLKPMSRIQLEDLKTLVLRYDSGMAEAIMECAA